MFIRTVPQKIMYVNPFFSKKMKIGDLQTIFLRYIALIKRRIGHDIYLRYCI
jgi:hypothetical protein